MEPRNGTLEFKKGVSLSVYQGSGEQEFESNWTKQVRRKARSSTSSSKDIIGVSNDFWNRYESDFQLAKDLGVTSLRISIEWHRVEPKQGEINGGAISRYHSMFKALLSAGITPVATLHHFVHPKWFEDLGAWRTDGNEALFVAFASSMVERFRKYTDMWVTFNEPAVLAAAGHIFGIFPPEGTAQFATAGRVFLNILKSHTAAYDAIKSRHPELQVGLVHQFIEMKAQSQWNLVSSNVAFWVTESFGRRVLVEWFENGQFRWRSPWGWRQVHYDSPTLPKTDFLGVNYYSRLVISDTFRLTGDLGEAISDSGFPSHPDGLLQHLRQARRLNVPIYITEFGAADRDDRMRPALLRDYYVAVCISVYG